MKETTLSRMFLNRIAEGGDAARYMVPEKGGYTPVTYRQVGEMVREICQGLMAAGLSRGDRVAILSGTRMEWCLVDIAAILGGFIPVPIYPSNLPDQVEYIANYLLRLKHETQTEVYMATWGPKEADTDEEARNREVRRDEDGAKREQEKDKAVAESQKVAVAEQYEVVRVEEVKMAEIMKQKALVVANQEKEVEEINKEQKRLDGEGDRIYLTEKAKGEASPVRERGLADAEAKMKLQDALNRFGPEAIRALVAEKLVEMQREIGIETAKALSNADLKVFAGGNSAKAGFDLGQMIESMSVASDSSAVAVLNRLARPNDLGFKDIMGVLTGVLNENQELKSEISKIKVDEEKPVEERKERGK